MYNILLMLIKKNSFLISWYCEYIIINVKFNNLLINNDIIMRKKKKKCS